jgi:uncharacterized membrane protein YphA (DoxX/SURF4 family)
VTDLRFDLDTRESPMEIVMRSMPRLMLGAGFVIIGMTKFTLGAAWTPLFDKIGLGEWFRYFTGGMQMAGGLLTLVPRTAMVGAGLIACTMAGAVVVDIVVMRSLVAIIPCAIFAIAVGVGMQAWANRR